jgi:DNA ligase D-like protein (predicted 3'-phosphoesterase)
MDAFGPFFRQKGTPGDLARAGATLRKDCAGEREHTMSANRRMNEYNRKRNFERTPEPSGTEGQERRDNSPIFVIQEHDATSHHYDLRLEVDGVLKSWAVPKGPSTNPAEKRLAAPTEDHPLAYADFEGVIPEGEYGAGPVIVWDRGTYRNLRAGKEDESLSMTQAIAQGKLEVWLEGQKLRGGYALIRMGVKEDANWLLIKMNDDEADARRNPTSTERQSVLSGKTIEEMAGSAREKPTS